MNHPNFYDADLFMNGPPHELWRTLRTEAPVYWNPLETSGFWAVLKHADVVRAAKDHTTFVSNRGVAHKSIADTMASPEVTLYPPGPRNLLMLDAPDHAPFRQIVSRAFTPAVIASFEPKANEILDDIFSDLRGAETCDFSIDVSSRLAASLFCDLMGLPRKEWKFFWEVTQGMNTAGDPEFAPEGEAARVAGDALRKTVEYFVELLNARHGDGRVTLFTRLLDAENKAVIDAGDFVALCMLLTNAGHDPARNAITHGVKALFDNPEQKALLMSDPSLLDTAVEEILRWASPLAGFGRYAAKDAEIRGQKIRAGERVMLFFASANRDEEVFENSFSFDIRRTPNPHVAFGAGPHTCIGSSLARMQIRAIFKRLFVELPNLAPAGPIQWVRSNFVLGIKHMPVRLR
jgi:cytochrome P450